MKFKKLVKFAADNYFLTAFVIIIAFVGVVSVYKLFYTKSTYVYAKVKIGQGLWWAGGAKPSIWMIDALKNEKTEQDLLGKPVAQIMNVRYYPWWGSDQFDVYLTVKLKVSGNVKTGKYNFKRSTIGVGSPIELEFPSIQVSGTIIDLNQEPFADRYVEETIVLSKRNAFPWEYEAIKIGDKYFDGETDVFEILDKKSTDTLNISSDLFGNSNPSITENRRYILVKAKISVKEKNGQLIFGEDQVIHLGKTINISTPNFTFADYIVGEIR
jgi:hypothetical protein